MLAASDCIVEFLDEWNASLLLLVPEVGHVRAGEEQYNGIRGAGCDENGGRGAIRRREEDERGDEGYEELERDEHICLISRAVNAYADGPTSLRRPRLVQSMRRCAAPFRCLLALLLVLLQPRDVLV
mgnify:CR=1 FL=1